MRLLWKETRQSNTTHDDEPVFGRRWMKGGEELLSVYGKDGAEYLIFQRHLLLLLIAYGSLILCFVLPTNLAFGMLDNPTEFSSSTLANMEAGSPLLWIHVVVGVLFTPMAMMVMKRFAESTLDLGYHDDHSHGNSLLLEHLPRSKRNKRAIEEWMSDKYPWGKVKDELLPPFDPFRHNCWTLCPGQRSLPHLLYEQVAPIGRQKGPSAFDPESLQQPVQALLEARFLWSLVRTRKFANRQNQVGSKPLLRTTIRGRQVRDERHANLRSLKR